jgi:hypothetical protein
MPSFANLPTEIESKILDYLVDDRKTLYSTIRVSQSWHKHTVDLLWQHFSADDLAGIEEPRRQHYADKVTKLEVMSSGCYSRFRSLSFSALTEVILDAHYLPDYRPRLGTVRISPYLQPTLRKLHLTCRFVLTEDALDLICLRCPLLEDFKLEAQLSFDYSYGILIHATFKFPKLLRLVLYLNNTASRSAMERMGEQLPVLEYLDIGHQYDDLWEDLSGAVFPQLRTLKFHCSPHRTNPDLYVRSMIQSCL